MTQWIITDNHPPIEHICVCFNTQALLTVTHTHTIRLLCVFTVCKTILLTKQDRTARAADWITARCALAPSQRTVGSQLPLINAKQVVVVGEGGGERREGGACSVVVVCMYIISKSTTSTTTTIITTSTASATVILTAKIISL